MSTIGYAATFNDLRKQMNPDGSIDRVIEVLNKSNPLLEDIPWVEGDLPIGNKTTIRASLPTPEGPRRINRGTSATKGTTKQIVDVCMHIEDRSLVDVELLAGKPNPQLYRMSEDDAHVEGMAQYMVDKLMYGSLDDDPDTINGFFTRYNTITGSKGSVGYQCIAAGTAGTNTNASVLMVDWGDRRVTGIYPKGTTAGLRRQDLGEDDVYDTDGKAFRAVQTLYSWKAGLAVHNVRSVVRVCNIDVSSIKSMSQSAQQGIIDNFIYGKNRIWHMKSPILYCSETVYSWLETWLTNKNNVHITRSDVMDGVPTLRFAGMPVKKMDCLKENEAALS